VLVRFRKQKEDLSFILISLIGISNLEECPLNRNIPVFVLVGGAIASLKLLQVLWKQYSRHREPAEEEATDTHNGSVEKFIYLFLIKLCFVYEFSFEIHRLKRLS
jgi:hypothetical protein